MTAEQTRAGDDARPSVAVSVRGISKAYGSTQALQDVSFDVAAETIEGTPPGPQTVILKFESTEAVKAWYKSPAYQAVVSKRLAATTGFAIIAQSMNFRS